MLRYLGFKALSMIPLMLAVAIVSFALVAILELKGNVAEEILGTGYTPEAAKIVEHELGLDQPLPVRFVKWLGNAVQGDFGMSLKYPASSVMGMVNEQIWPTLSIVFYSMLLGSTIGILFGIWSGIRPGSKLDRVLSFTSATMIAAPGFVLSMLLVVVFAVKFGWFDPTGYRWPAKDGWWAWFKSIQLPAWSLALSSIAVVQRQLRSSMSATLQSRYVLAARARGVPARTVVRRHAMRNALIPTVTVIGFQASNAIGLTVAVEQVFAISGMGSLLTQAIQARDVTVVQGTLMIAAAIVAIVNLLVDASYAWLNPKVRFE